MHILLFDNNICLTRIFYFFNCLYSFVFLFLENYGVRKLEAVFAVLIGTMAVTFAWMFGETKPNGMELLLGEKMRAVYLKSFSTCNLLCIYTILDLLCCLH
jgi:Mn2+/Fe2+ NRAMP family transporter